MKFSSESGSRRWACDVDALGPNGPAGERAHGLAAASVKPPCGSADHCIGTRTA